MVSANAGGRAEKSVDTLLSRPVSKGGKPIFDVRFLGEKAMLVDFMVRLVNADERLTGVYFFLQIKAAGGSSQFLPTARPNRIKIEFTAAEVAQALNMDVPVYVVAVDVRSYLREAAYICGLDSDRTAGLYAVPMRHRLLDSTVRLQLYAEVTAFFTDRIPVKRRSIFSSALRLS